MIYEEEAYLYGDEIENEEEDTDPNGININALCLFTPEDGVGLDPTTAYVVPLDPFDVPAVKCPSPTAVKCEPCFVTEEAPTVEDRAARSYYEDPVNLDAVYSRQYIRFWANGVMLMGLLDGGAEVNLMPRSTYQKHFTDLPLVPNSTPVKGAFGNKGESLDGLIQLRLNIKGEIINANFAVADVPASDTVIIGMALMDTLRLCLDYDEIGKRIVKIGPEGRIVSSCIKVDHKFVAVRTVAVETHPAIAPLCQAQSLRVMTLHLDSTQYLDGSIVYMEADTTDDGLIVPAQVAEVQHGTIPVQVMNPTNSVQYVDSEIFHLQKCESDEVFPLIPSSTWAPQSDPSPTPSISMK